MDKPEAYKCANDGAFFIILAGWSVGHAYTAIAGAAPPLLLVGGPSDRLHGCRLWRS